MRVWSLVLLGLSCVLSLLAPGCGERSQPPPTSSTAPRPRTAPLLPPRQPKPPPPRAEETLAVEDGATEAAQKLIELTLDIKESVTTTRYQARTEVKPDEGLYAWDCSGMANWMLRRTAPRARRALGKSRPRAIDFYNIIKRSPTDKARRGWRRLEHVSDARPGDVFAFPRSKLSTSKISGHVGFFVEQPWKVKDFPYRQEAWAARILDATGLPHENDTRDRDSEGGFGFGTFLFVNDENGDTIAYGWFGTRSRGFMPTTVEYGRVTR